MNWLNHLQRDALLAMVRLIVGAHATAAEPPPAQTVIFSNHTSHLDTMVLLASLPPDRRNRTRPVAAADYWGTGALRRYVALTILDVVLVDRAAGGPAALVPLEQALDEGSSLIVFPEGTRRRERLPGRFKSGLYHLSRPRPTLALTPAYVENTNRVMPRGAPIPLPLLCQVRLGDPIYNDRQEHRDAFLERAHAAVCALAPGGEAT
jgi:1-acyl-sn-glycerol-3-phosphate acyltransferase